MRTKKMRGLPVIIMFLVMGPFCLAAIEPDITEIVVEPNDPNWTPSDCFVPAWERVTLSTQLSNPEEVSGATGYNSIRTLSISCNLYKADIRNLISSTTFLYPTEAQAVDDQDNVYSYERSFYTVHVNTTQSDSSLINLPTNISLSFPIDPNTGYPIRLKQVSWSIDGIFAHAIRSIKVPFEASDEWIEILPDYSILIEEALIEENMYSYLIKAKYEGPDSLPRSLLTLRNDDPIPQYIDMGISLLDEHGIDVRSYPGSGGFTSSGGGSDRNYTISGSGFCGACGGVKTIQFQFAVDSYVAKMPYLLNDIPVPVF